VSPTQEVRVLHSSIRLPPTVSAFAGIKYFSHLLLFLRTKLLNVCLIWLLSLLDTPISQRLIKLCGAEQHAGRFRRTIADGRLQNGIDGGARPLAVKPASRHADCQRHASSRSRRTASLAGFFDLSHTFDGPLRWGVPLNRH
jgi:hypothetical protein